MEENFNGILVVNKPSGITSRDVVNRVSKVLHTKKIGHTGTLDPLATGVLILTIGKCTKFSDFLASTFKVYEVEAELGYETDTLDYTGITTKKSDIVVDEERIREVVNSFIGNYMQEVPAYSAVKINGKKLYEYARNGEAVELPKREVCIKSIEDLEAGKTHVKFTCCVSKGTYIRSLIRDIGVKLGCYATMTKLVRIKQNNFSIDESYTLDDIESGKYKILGLDRILEDTLKIECDINKYREVSNGVKQKEYTDINYITYTYNNEYVALYKKDKDIYRMYVKF